MKKEFPFVSLAAMLFLTGCNPPVGIGLAEAGAAWITKPSTPDAADTASQIAPHESWCYRTLGTIECFDQPQDDAGNRMINVDPQNRYPLNARAYAEVVTQNRMAEEAKNKPPMNAVAVPAESVAPVAVQPAEVTPLPQATPKKLAKPKKTVAKHKAKKHHAPKAKKRVPSAIPNPPADKK